MQRRTERQVGLQPFFRRIAPFSPTCGLGGKFPPPDVIWSGSHRSPMSRQWQSGLAKGVPTESPTISQQTRQSSDVLLSRLSASNSSGCMRATDSSRLNNFSRRPPAPDDQFVQLALTDSACAFCSASRKDYAMRARLAWLPDPRWINKSSSPTLFPRAITRDLQERSATTAR